MKLRISILIPFILSLTFVTSHAENINVSIAASMTDAIKEATTVFSKNHPNAIIRSNIAGSGSLAKQILQGAPADIYISANPKWMDYLVENKMIAPGTDLIFAFNKLVFISENKSKYHSMESIKHIERVAIGSPQNVPAGKYAKQAMESAGIYSLLQKKNKLIFAKDVRQALLYADRGEVNGAFVYQTDAMIAQSAKVAFIVPEELYKRVSYPIGLTTSGVKKPLANAFYEFITSSDGAAILSKFGFEPNI